MKSRLSLLVVAGLLISGAGVLREAQATTAECKRTITRTPKAGGGYNYTDGGCPEVLCDQGAGDNCYDHFIIGLGGPRYCTCTTSVPACSPQAHYDSNGNVYGASCKKIGCAQDCTATWSGTPQTLSCGCP